MGGFDVRLVTALTYVGQTWIFHADKETYPFYFHLPDLATSIHWE